MAAVPPHHKRFHVIQYCVKTLVKYECDVDQNIFNRFETGCMEWIYESKYN